MVGAQQSFWWSWAPHGEGCVGGGTSHPVRLPHSPSSIQDFPASGHLMRASPSEEPSPHMPPLLCHGNSPLTLRTSSFSSPVRGSPGLWDPPVVLGPPPWLIGGCGHPKAQLTGPVPGALSHQHPWHTTHTQLTLVTWADLLCPCFCRAEVGGSEMRLPGLYPPAPASLLT